ATPGGWGEVGRRPRSMAARLGHPVGRAGGHGKSKLSPAAGCALHDDRAAVRFDQPLHDVEAEPGAASPLGPPELAEDTRDQFRRHAVTLVAHGDRDALARAARAPGIGEFQRPYPTCHATRTL